MNTLAVDLNKLKQPHWTAEEVKHAELVSDFVQKLMNEHDFEYVEKVFGGNTYRQHNRNMSDGISGVIQTVKSLVKRSPAYTYDVKHISVDGDVVHFHSHVTLNEKHRGNPNVGFNIKDTWRIEEGAIVEHWDAIQPINGAMRFYAWMVGGKIANENTLF